MEIIEPESWTCISFIILRSSFAARNVDSFIWINILSIHWDTSNHFVFILCCEKRWIIWNNISSFNVYHELFGHSIDFFIHMCYISSEFFQDIDNYGCTGLKTRRRTNWTPAIIDWMVFDNLSEDGNWKKMYRIRSTENCSCVSIAYMLRFRFGFWLVICHFSFELHGTTHWQTQNNHNNWFWTTRKTILCELTH